MLKKLSWKELEHSKFNKIVKFDCKICKMWKYSCEKFANCFTRIGEAQSRLSRNGGHCVILNDVNSIKPKEMCTVLLFAELRLIPCHS